VYDIKIPTFVTNGFLTEELNLVEEPSASLGIIPSTLGSWS